MRINRYLAMCGVASRRAAEKLVQQGRVSINGHRINTLVTDVNEKRDIVCVDDRKVTLSDKTYLMLNKPKGFITTARDEKSRKTVFDLIKIKKRVFPIGRLDRNTEGLLLFCNDGDLAYRLMHPKYKVAKIYRVKLNRIFNAKDFDPLVTGVELEDGITAKCQARYYTENLRYVELKISEGRYHQIKRMFEALGYQVVALKRIRYGPIALNTLGRGKWRFLKLPEIKNLKKTVGM